MLRYGLLLLVPVSLGLAFLSEAGPLVVFVSAGAAVAVLADWVRRATQQLAERAGSAVGGLLNVTFGSLAELVLSLFVLASGQVEVVQAQITGSIIGTALLGLGLAMLVGGLGRARQTFSAANAGLLSTLLILVVIALLLPAVFDMTVRAHQPDPAASDERLSLGVAIVLLVLYAANLAFTLVTHRGVFVDDERDGSGGWGVPWALAVMVGATALIALESELVSGAVGSAAERLGVAPAFLGVIALALVGTSADLFAAVAFARQDRMNIVFSICVGSAIQVALVVAPLLVLLSWAIGHPMNLVFGNGLDLLAIAGAAFAVRAIAADGETNWFEGLVLVGVYVLLALGFFFVGGT